MICSVTVERLLGLQTSNQRISESDLWDGERRSDQWWVIGLSVCKSIVVSWSLYVCLSVLNQWSILDGSNSRPWWHLSCVTFHWSPDVFNKVHQRWCFCRYRWVNFFLLFLHCRLPSLVSLLLSSPLHLFFNFFVFYYVSFFFYIFIGLPFFFSSFSFASSPFPPLPHLCLLFLTLFIFHFFLLLPPHFQLPPLLPFLSPFLICPPHLLTPFFFVSFFHLFSSFFSELTSSSIFS